MFLCLSPPVVQKERRTRRSTPPIVVDGEEAYQVWELLDFRCQGRVLQYLVDWESYGPEEWFWVNSQEILDPTLTAEFHRTHPDNPAPRPHGRPWHCVPPRFRSHSQGGGSVTNQASVAPSDHHQKELSPEY
ncbi:M-phase phosphoprotein 8 [Labeo rohita]|uniref:M-phase phosphoprotein 8 n=1 Tax=Labeo rohita TaxID=84645 RepID=A0ABQ8LSD6_LABRO|nr:M-phase phosphoprotein 8 [Labeo rohita]